MSRRDLKFDKKAMFETIAQNIRELSDATEYGSNDPFQKLPADERLQYINDLALSMIDLLAPRPAT